MADVAKKGVSTAESTNNGFINNVTSDTNTTAPGGGGGDGDEEGSPAAPDLLSFHIPASDDGASLQELIESELAMRINSATAEEAQDEEQVEEPREEPVAVGATVITPNSPPSDLLLDFTEPTSPLGATVIDPFVGVASEYPEFSPEEGTSPEEAVVPSGRAPWAEAEVEVEDVVAEVVEGVLGGAVGDRRVPFIGPAEVSLVDFSTTVTDDSAFEMLTPPTEDKVFGVNIPEIRVDTPPSSTPEEEEEGIMGDGSVEDEGVVSSNVQYTQEVESPVDEVVERPVDLGSPLEDLVSSPLDVGSPLEEAGGVVSVSEDIVVGGGGRVVDAISSPDDDGWECVGGVRVEGFEDEVSGAADESPIEKEIEEESNSETAGLRAMDMFEGTVVEEEEDDLGGPVDEQAQWRGEERELERVVQEVAPEERVEGGGIEVVEVVEEPERVAATFVEREEPPRDVEEVASEDLPVEEERQEVQESIKEERFVVEEELKEDQEIYSAEEVAERLRVEVEVESECPSVRVGEEEEVVVGDVEEQEEVEEPIRSPIKENGMPIGKIVIPSTFGGTGGSPSPDQTDRGPSPCVRHADVTSECGVPASRPSLVDWNAVVKKEEQKGESGLTSDSTQDAEPTKKAGTRKVKKDSGGDGKKKSKKGKKSDAEKENFSVNSQLNMGSQLGVGFHKGENDTKEMDEEGLSGINLQSLRETYCSQASKTFQGDDKAKDIVVASVSINDLKRSFQGDDEPLSPSSEEDIDVEMDEDDDDEEEERLGSDAGLDGRPKAPYLEFGEGKDVTIIEKTREADDDGGSDDPQEGGMDQNGHGNVKYYRSFSRLEQRTFGNLEVEKRAKSLVDLRRQSENLQQDLDGNYFGSPNREPIFTGVSVKALRASYCNLINIEEPRTTMGRTLEPDQRSSFNKFDQLSKKTVLHVKSVDSTEVQKKFNEAAAVSSTVGPSLCRSCCKQVFQMEQIKAERAVWHKNCFRCKECSKQLTLDIYSSHEGQLYCKPHFKELFKPKVVVETEHVGPVRPRKPEMIIRENQPVELPPEVVRASDKPDLGLEELSSLNLKSRYRVFEKDSSEESGANLEKSSSGVNVKRSPSILSKLARFQKKGMDIGVTDDSLNGVPFEQSDSSSEEASSSEGEGEDESGVVKSSRHKKKERPMSFGKMNDMKNKWESVGDNGVRKTKEELREERKEEIQRLRSRLFMGKLRNTKEMYEQAVMESEKGTAVTSNGVKRQPSERAKSLKERFERGETGVDLVDDAPEDIKKEKEEMVRRAKEEELSVFEAGISKKSRSLFLELDKVQQQQAPAIPTPTKSPLPKEEVRRAREVIMARQVSDDVVRSSDRMEDVQIETADICNKFKFFETYQEAPRQRKQFRITPPREGQVKLGSPERDIYRDPNVVRCEDPPEDDSEVVVKSHTTTKMLSLFRQMEENANKEDVPEGPKPLKRFTPPPDYVKNSESEEEDEDEDDEEDEEDDEEEEEEQQEDGRDPNIVRASDKVEDEFLKQATAQNAARAKSLRAKFEKWEAEMEKRGENANGTIGDEETPSVDTTRNLRARFESMQSEAKSAAAQERQRPRVNRFVEIQASCAELCSSCGIRVYPLEKVEAGGKVLHKTCFRCLHCKCFLRMDTYTMNNGNLYCMTHFKQLFIAKGNYDEGFGTGQHKEKWSSLKKKSKQDEVINDGLSRKVDRKDNFFDEDSFCTEDLQ